MARCNLDVDCVSLLCLISPRVPTFTVQVMHMTSRFTEGSREIENFMGAGLGVTRKVPSRNKEFPPLSGRGSS